MTAIRTPGRTTDGVIFVCHATILCVTKVVLVSRRTIGRRTASCILHEFSSSQRWSEDSDSRIRLINT